MPGGKLAERLEVRGERFGTTSSACARGYPVESLTGPAGGYRLQAGRQWRQLLLDDEEAIAIAVGVHGRARVGARNRGDPETGAGGARAGAAGAPAPPRT